MNKYMNDDIENIDLTGSFDLNSDDSSTVADLESGLSYEDLNPEERRAVKKEIRKFKTRY
jgi:hypothetical protein